MSKKFWHTPAPVRNKQRELKANAYREGYNDGYKAGVNYARTKQNLQHGLFRGNETNT